MKITATLLSLAAVLAVTEALSGEVPLTRNPHFKHNTRAEMQKLNKRYPQLRLADGHHRSNLVTSGSGVGSVPIVDVHPDLEYYGTVKVGTPAKSFRLDFDTGSADIWFPSTACKSSACKSHTRFDSSKSSTYKKDGRQWELEYADGSSASGILGSDMVNVGGISVRQTIGLAKQESSEFGGSPEDGLFGLGFSSIESVYGVKTFMDNAIAGNKLKSPVISVFLPSVRRNGGKDGHYLFGDIDHSRYTGNLTYVPVTEVGYWQIKIQGLHVNGKSVHQSSQGIIDTGTTLMILSDKAAKSVHASIKGSKNDEFFGWTVPCSTKNSKENIAFEMGGKYFNVPVADLAYEAISNGSKTCLSGVQGGMDGLWILGDVFIKNNYCVFEHSQNPRIGIAPLKY